MREIALQLRELMVASDHYRQAVAAALKLGVPETVTLGHLYHAGQLTPTSIASRLGMTTASVTGLLDRLTGSGYVTREPNPRDRRSILVSLTEQGTRTTQVMFDLFVADIESAANDIAPAERTSLSRFLRRAAAALHQRVADQHRLVELLGAALRSNPPAAPAEPDQPDTSAT